MELLNLHRIVDVTAAEGPGVRCAVWTQGCSVRCPGCFNPQTWTTRGGFSMPWPELVSRVLAISGIEGVTLLGGEPFDQAEPLGHFASAVREAGLSVLTFTGRVREELPPSKLLASTDLLVDGPFLVDRPERERPWVGSENQRFHFLTGRYDESIFTTPNRLELTIAPDGGIELNGFATTEVLEALLEGDRR